MTGVRVVPLTSAHADAVLAIFQAGIDGGDASFEPHAPTWEAWDAAHLPAHRFVAVDGDEVLGWVALSPVSPRPVYRGVAEVSVYVAPAAQGRGVGRALLEAVIASSEAGGLWTLQAGIFPENTASLALHRACGFRVVGVRERLGRHRFGPGGRRGAQAPLSPWRDVVLLERRSTVVGTD